MPIDFFLHTDVSDMNERRALYRVASLLKQRFQAPTEQYVALIANIVPDRSQGLTQLDALVLAENTVAIVEFKNYPDPINGQDPNGQWFVEGGKQVVHAGQSINPYRQAQRARGRWRDFFINNISKVIPNHHQRRNLNWSHMNSYVLFNPYLHEQSQIMHPGEDHLWLNFAGVEEILALMYAGTPDIRLSADEIQLFVNSLLGARRWHEMKDLLSSEVGYLIIEEEEGPSLAYPIQKYDEVSIGRSRQNRIQISAEKGHTSSHHLILVTQKQRILAIDLSSKHGSFLNGEQFEMTPLQDGDHLTLGGTSGETVAAIQFVRNKPASATMPTMPTLP